MQAKEQAGSMGTLLKTKALVCRGAGEPFSLEDVYIDRSELDDDQALVEFRASGIWCVTHLPRWRAGDG